MCKKIDAEKKNVSGETNWARHVLAGKRRAPGNGKSYLWRSEYLGEEGMQEGGEYLLRGMRGVTEPGETKKGYLETNGSLKREGMWGERKIT